ncbi:MAG: DUF3626 domain-containing protein [Chloroflexi bacterium]|nr:DUF3626 domain-containing protein [Chloroflexota bacterium]
MARRQARARTVRPSGAGRSTATPALAAPTRAPLHPHSPADVLQLQRAVGNRATTALISRQPVIQRWPPWKDKKDDYVIEISGPQGPPKLASNAPPPRAQQKPRKPGKLPEHPMQKLWRDFFAKPDQQWIDHFWEWVPKSSWASRCSKPFIEIAIASKVFDTKWDIEVARSFVEKELRPRASDPVVAWIISGGDASRNIDTLSAKLRDQHQFDSDDKANPGGQKVVSRIGEKISYHMLELWNNYNTYVAKQEKKGFGFKNPFKRSGGGEGAMPENFAIVRNDGPAVKQGGGPAAPVVGGTLPPAPRPEELIGAPRPGFHRGMGLPPIGPQDAVPPAISPRVRPAPPPRPPRPGVDNASAVAPPVAKGRPLPVPPQKRTPWTPATIQGGAHDSRMTKFQQENLTRLKAEAAKKAVANTAAAKQKLILAGVEPGKVDTTLNDVIAYLKNSPTTINFDPSQGGASLFEKLSGYTPLWEAPLAEVEKKTPGYLNKRQAVEQKYLGYNDDVRTGGNAKDRPVYASTNVGGAVPGGADQYGKSYFELKDEVKERSTFSQKDTFSDTGITNIGSSDHLQGVVADMPPEKIAGILKMLSKEKGARGLGQNEYIEAHIHGPVEWTRDIKRMVLDRAKVPPGSVLEQQFLRFAKTNGIEVVYYNYTAWESAALQNLETANQTHSPRAAFAPNKALPKPPNRPQLPLPAPKDTEPAKVAPPRPPRRPVPPDAQLKPIHHGMVRVGPQDEKRATEVKVAYDARTATLAIEAPVKPVSVKDRAKQLEGKVPVK